MRCRHNWSEETHDGVPSRFCHVCNEWEIEVEYDRALAEVARLREEVARLNALLASVTDENQDRAKREARSLEDWRELRAENDRLKASRLPDVEYARLDTMWQELVRERDAAVVKATAHERDWYEAKSEFGTATAKLREKVRTLESALTTETRVSLDYQNQRDELRAQLAFLREEYGANAGNGTLTRDALEQKIQVLIHERRQLRARLVECRAWAGRCPYPNTPAFDELISVRELADDTLEEVKP